VPGDITVSIDLPDSRKLDTRWAAITNWFLEALLALHLPEDELSQLRGLRELVEVKQILSKNVVKWSHEWIGQGQARWRRQCWMT